MPCVKDTLVYLFYQKYFLLFCEAVLYYKYQVSSFTLEWLNYAVVCPCTAIMLTGKLVVEWYIHDGNISPSPGHENAAHQHLWYTHEFIFYIIFSISRTFYNKFSLQHKQIWKTVFADGEGLFFS